MTRLFWSREQIASFEHGPRLAYPGDVALTPKQQRFVNEYLVDLNATQAAIRAGYSPRTARNQASDLLAKPDIQDAIRSARAEQQARTQITADYVLRRLRLEAHRTGKGSQHSARVRALELLGRHLGLWVEAGDGQQVVVQVIRGIDERTVIGEGNSERDGGSGGGPSRTLPGV